MPNNNLDDYLKAANLSREDFAFVEAGQIQADRIPDTPPIGFFRDAMRRFGRNKASVLSLAVVVLIAFFAIVGPFMDSFTYRQQNVKWDKLPPRVPYLEKLGIFNGTAVLTVQKANIETDYKIGYIKTIREHNIKANGLDVPMADIVVDMYKLKGADDVYFWLGSDGLGRDLWTRLWRGARISLAMAFLAVFLNALIGVIYGAISAYYGKNTDLFMQRVIEIIGSIPLLPLLILFIIKFGTGIVPIVLALCITGWIGMANLIRSQFYRYKGREYVLAAQTMGVRDRRVIFRHILPNAIGPAITQTAISIPEFIMAESMLAYLGLGIQAPEASVGVLLSEGQQVLFSAPHLLLFPAIIISLLMLCFNLISGGLRDAFDPAQRG
ncbi:peptide ABC transporter permease [Clostridia bacterium]|nr:peptide ABC transporter permease [Clostridia bacterium]